MRVFFVLFVIVLFLSACGDLGVAKSVETPVAPSTNLTQTYYDTEGRMGSSWQVQPVGYCKFEVNMDGNGILYMSYSAGCQVENAGRGIRIQPKKGR